MKLQIELNEEEERVMNARAAEVGMKLGKPVSLPKLLRMWIDRGCPGSDLSGKIGGAVGGPRKQEVGKATQNIVDPPREQDKPIAMEKVETPAQPPAPKIIKTAAQAESVAGDLRSARENIPNFLKK